MINFNGDMNSVFYSSSVTRFCSLANLFLQSFELAQRIKLEKTLATTESNLDAARAELLRLNAYVRHYVSFLYSSVESETRKSIRRRVSVLPSD